MDTSPSVNTNTPGRIDSIAKPSAWGPVIANFVLFEVTWIAGLYSAGIGRPVIGTLCFAVFAAWHFATSRQPRADFVLMLTAACLGLLADTLFIQAHILVYASPLPFASIAPFWIIVLWMNFALTINLSMAWLQGRPVLIFLVGLIGGPLAYYSGLALDAAKPAATLPVTYGVIGAVWAVIVPTLFYVARRQKTL